MMRTDRQTTTFALLAIRSPKVKMFAFRVF